MWKFLEHKQIDIQRWDEAIKADSEALIYAESWYLDLVAPQWAALVYGDYQCLLAVPLRKKLGVRYWFQPDFIQRLDLSGPNKSVEMPNWSSLLPAGVVHVDATTGFPLAHNSQERKNILLSLDQKEDEMLQGFSKNTLRNYKKGAKQAFEEVQGGKKELDSLIELFVQSKPSLAQNLPQSYYSSLRKIMNKAFERNCGKLLFLKQNQALVAGIALVQNKSRSTLLFSAAGDLARKQGAMHYLIGNYVLSQAGSGHLFDFEGSANLGVARFYLSFGGETETYFHTRRRRILKRSL